ncbi:helix-turn-helix domain-containing protein [Sphingomonas changnyeongensis]|uniref:Helix-turn-helix domain-containing protein n=1 Tax=Sphingomonas changnyeongensis TaxID=2698679 RepID=A0A7Z2S904_9SPHN|nr:helix-turn-helix domain-containing protein [Sphingomonas changnyeongensis]QHL91257.1 helix-turn-helix domain-containing protein [Sphingomonas changnyeongensis]
MRSPRLLDSAAAADRLGISERTLRDLRKRGLIRYVAVTERKIMYRPEDCESYIEGRTKIDTPAEANRSARPQPARRRPGNVVPFTAMAR